MTPIDNLRDALIASLNEKNIELVENNKLKAEIKDLLEQDPASTANHTIRLLELTRQGDALKGFVMALEDVIRHIQTNHDS